MCTAAKDKSCKNQAIAQQINSRNKRHKVKILVMLSLMKRTVVETGITHNVSNDGLTCYAFIQVFYDC